MPNFRIEGPPNVAGLFASDNWMSALGDALARAGGETSGLECDVLEDGTIRVHSSSWQFTIAEERETVARIAIETPEPRAAAMAAAVPAPTRSLGDSPSPIVEIEEEDTSDFISDLDAPDPTRLSAFRAVEERADDTLAEIAAAAERIASGEAALDLLMQHIPAESGAVLVHDASTGEMRFVAARGPRSRALRGMAIPQGKGIAGLVASRSVSLTVREARTDPRHYGEVDRAVGYTTRAILCVPIRNERGTVGVLQLLNPFAGAQFAGWHQTAAQLVAGQLAGRLG